MKKNNSLLEQKIKLFLGVAIVILAGYFAYQFYQAKTLEEFNNEIVISDLEDKIPLQCESGEWTEFPDYSGTGKFPEFKGNVTLKMVGPDRFTNEDGSIVFTTDEKYSLAFFSDKALWVEGSELDSEKEKKVYVKKIKCVGKEADAEIQGQRQNLMRYINENIDSLALEKSPNGKWLVATFYFVNDTDLYVEYESAESILGDGPYDAHLWLIRVSKLERQVPVIETLAYIQEDEEDPEKNIVKQGTDIYADATGMATYEFNEDANRWVMQ